MGTRHGKGAEMSHEFQGPSHEDPHVSKATAGDKKVSSRRQLDFELEFFEGILERCPDFVDVLRVHANNLTTRGLYARGLEADRRLVQLRPNDPITHYNLACSHALLLQTDAAIAALESSLKLGYLDFEHLLGDPDLERVRDDARFLGMLGRHLKRLKRSSKSC